MALRQRLEHEFKVVAAATLYFACWLTVLMTIKVLVLSEYHIEFRGWSLIPFGALALSKVVVVLEHVPLGAWVRSRPAWVDVGLRTLLYSVGVFLVLALEQAFHGRHEHGSFMSSLRSLPGRTDLSHMAANTLGVGGSLLIYNVLAVFRRYVGEGSLLHVLLVPLPEAPPARQPG